MSFEGRTPADGENTTRGKTAALTPLAPGQGETFGRSPDLRVIAWPDLPITHGMTVALPASLSAYSCGGSRGVGKECRTAFPFNRTANRPDRSRRTIQTRTSIEKTILSTSLNLLSVLPDIGPSGRGTSGNVHAPAHGGPSDTRKIRPFQATPLRSVWPTRVPGAMGAAGRGLWHCHS